MKRSASEIGDCSGGEGARKLAKCTAGGGNDAGGSLAPYLPMWHDNNTSPTSSESAISSSLQGSDDEDEGNGRGGGLGAGTQEDDEEKRRMENLEPGELNSALDREMQQILACFTPEQTTRYEKYRRSGFDRSAMRKLLAIVADCPISLQISVVMCGITKIFVGELVETGRIVMTERNEVGPIRPCHIREAYRRLKLDGIIPSRGTAQRFK